MQTRAKNYLIILLALSTVTAGAVAWQKTKQLSQLQATLSANSAGKVKKTAATRSGSYSGVTADKTTAPADDNSTAPDDQNNNRQQRRNGRANFEALMKDPKFAKAMAVEQTARLNMRYGALYKQLNLSPDQQKALSSLLAERQNSARDVMDAARQQGLNPGQDRDAINQMIQQAQAQVDQNIQSALGASGYSQYQQYQNSEAQRNVVSDLNQTLAASSTTLSTAQANFLQQALGSTGTTGGGGGPGGFGGQQATITDAVIAQAQGVLTSDQIAALQQLQAQQQAQQTMRQMFQAQQRANNNGN